MPEFQYGRKKYNSPVELTLDILGGKWKMPVLWRLKDGPRRYGQIKRTLPRTSHKMLAAQLQDLEKHGFVKRRVYPTVPPAVEYSLTGTGRAAIPVIELLRNFGERLRTGTL
jgi:DNA-binding HxlR family transcriptional regulator